MSEDIVRRHWIINLGWLDLFCVVLEASFLFFINICLCSSEERQHEVSKRWENFHFWVKYPAWISCHHNYNWQTDNNQKQDFLWVIQATVRKLCAVDWCNRVTLCPLYKLKLSRLVSLNHNVFFCQSVASNKRETSQPIFPTLFLPQLTHLVIWSWETVLLLPTLICSPVFLSFAVHPPSLPSLLFKKTVQHQKPLQRKELSLQSAVPPIPQPKFFVLNK